MCVSPLDFTMKAAPLDFKNPIQDAVTRLRFAPHSNNLLISSWDLSLRLYDVDSSQVRLEAPSDAAHIDCCFQTESVALSAGSDGLIRRYDLHTGTEDIIGNHDDLAKCIECSDETCLVISAGWDKKLMFWDTRSKKTIRCLNTICAEVESIALHGHRLIVAIGSFVNIYDLRTLQESVQTKELHMNFEIKCVRPTITSQGFAVGSVDGRVSLEYLDPSNSDTEGYTFRCHPKTEDGRYHLASVNDIAFNPSILGAFVTADSEGYVIAWDAKIKKRLFEHPKYPNSVSSLTYNQGGQLLAVASNYGHQVANDKLEPSQIFVHEMDDLLFARSSK